MRHRIWQIAICIVIGMALGAALILFFGPKDTVPAGALHSSDIPAGHERLYAAAVSVARAVYESDYALLSEWTHPQQGCLFSPFSTVDRQKNLTFTPAQIQAMKSDKTEYAWSAADQTGQPVSMTSAEFFRNYLQIRDFSVAPGVGFDIVLRTGNAVENIQNEFPDCHVVDLYFPGAGKDPAGADWASLKLAFTLDEGGYKLVAVVRSVYTEQ